MKRIVSVVLASMFALMLGTALVGCGGSEDYTANFAGEYKLVEMEENGEVTPQEDLAMLEALGLTVNLNLNAEDGTAELDMMGDVMSGTWTANSATECSVTLDGETLDGTLADNMLTISDGSSSMTFEKNVEEA